jgi:hypothetical protein
MDPTEKAGSAETAGAPDEQVFENTLAKYRWVLISADFDVVVWDKEGLAQPTDDLPVTPDLQMRLDAWAEQYDLLDSAIEGASLDKAMGCDVELPPEDWEALSIEGFDLACAVKCRLPEWKVFYWDRDIYEKSKRAYLAHENRHTSIEIVLDKRGKMIRPGLPDHKLK